MKIHSVRMSNFKSLGTINNELIIEPSVTAIIGKNESGKSNILEGLSKISFDGNMTSAFIPDNANRNNGTTAEMKYQITLMLNSKEIESLKTSDDTTIVIRKDSYALTGGILNYYNREIREFINKLIENLGQNPFILKDPELKTFRTYIDSLKQTDYLDIKVINNAILFIEARISKLPVDKQENIDNIVGTIKSKLGIINHILPTIVYRNTDKILRATYKLDEIKKELQTPSNYPNSLLSNFLKLIGIPDADFIAAATAGSTGPKSSLRERVNDKIDRTINAEFKSFYTTESISLKAEFDSNLVSFIVKSNGGETLLLSERSNGLRWYLSTFIDAKTHDISESNVIYLFDEPGISLHVNAQKELLKLFKDLTDKGNQIIYTTHSPYMLSIHGDGIHRIRATEKDNYGYTHIFKTAYDTRLSPKNQHDTIAPIIDSIGMTIYDTFGPAHGKINVVTEGVSDYIYLSTMAKILNINMNKINIIPSLGVNNAVNLCNILRGWDCPFIAIFDYDREGVESGGEKMRKSLLYEMGKHYIYLRDVDQDTVSKKDYNKLKYTIEDLVGKEVLDDYIKRNDSLEGINFTNTNKTLISKLFCNAIENNEYDVDRELSYRFKELFDRILSAYPLEEY